MSRPPHRVTFTVDFDGDAWASATPQARTDWVDTIADAISAHAYVSAQFAEPHPGDALAAPRADAHRLFAAWLDAARAEEDTFDASPEQVAATRVTAAAYDALVARLDATGQTGGYYDPRGGRDEDPEYGNDPDSRSGF